MQFLPRSPAPVVSVVATAKKDLSVGDVVSEFGGFEAYGLAENQDTVEAENLLPFGLALGAKLVRDIPKDQVLTVADVAIPPDRLVDALYAEQRVRFSPPVPPATTAVR
jgi:predicted homoserine dehydrogenase-like protein